MAARGRMPEQLEPAVSAGGVVYRQGRHDIEIVLCGRRSERLWLLPKGTPEVGEALEHAALREVEEETGLAVEIEEKVGSIRYQFAGPDGTRYDKRVEQHLMVPVGGSLDGHDGEFDDVRWTAIEEALKLLSYLNERAIVLRAVRVIHDRGDS